jgi:hypothetical protein
MLGEERESGWLMFELALEGWLCIEAGREVGDWNV